MSDTQIDVLVIGAGPAGIAAAASASATGVSVVLIDSNPAPGGQIWRANQGVPPHSARRWLAALDRVDIWCSALVVDASGLRFAVAQGGRIRHIEAQKVVLATGARERFIPFPGWTSTGVLGVGGLQAFAKQGFEVEGMRVVVAGSGPLLLAVADNLRRRSAKVVAIVEQAPRARIHKFAASLISHPAKLAQAIRLKSSLIRVPQYYGAWPVAVTRRWGEKQPKSKLGGELELSFSRSDGSRFQLGADLLAVGFGLVPDTRIAEYLGCAVEAGAVVTDAMQRTSLPSVYAAGESTGVGGVDVALAEGRVAGFAAAGASGLASNCQTSRRREQAFADRCGRAFALRDELRSLPDDDTIVCRCEDVRWRDLREVTNLRAAKLQTRCGMGACQGRVCGPALEFLTGVRAERVRPPFEPVTMDLLTQIRMNSAAGPKTAALSEQRTESSDD